MVSLQHKKKTLNTEELIYGINPVIEVLLSGKEIEKIFFQKTLHPSKTDKIKTLATERNVPFQFVPKEKLYKITRKNHQGVIAIVSPLIYSNIEHVIPELFEQGKTPFFIVLDQVTDVRNLGSIARSAECAGVDAIIIPDKGTAMLNADAVKTSAGALTRIKVCRVSSLKNSLKFIKESGIKIVGASEKAKKLYFETEYNSPIAILMGSEEKGIGQELIPICDDLVKIPMQGKINSLNVSVASGIILFEALKHRM